MTNRRFGMALLSVIAFSFTAAACAGATAPPAATTAPAAKPAATTAAPAAAPAAPAAATTAPAAPAATKPAAAPAATAPAAAAPAASGGMAALPKPVAVGDPKSYPAVKPKNGQSYVIGLSMEAIDHPALVTIYTNVENAAKQLGWQVIRTDGGGDPVKQVAGMEDMVAKGIDMLMVQAAKAAPLKPALDRYSQQKLPFMFVGKPIKETAAISLVGPDNYYIGQQAGKWWVEALKKKNGSAKGNIFVIEGIIGDETSVDRIQGAKDVWKDTPDIKIVAQQPADYRQPQAVRVVANLLQANPQKIDGIFAANGDMALGALVAAKDAGRLGEFLVTGIDCSPEELTSIKAGEETACFAWVPDGEYAVGVAKDYFEGKPVPPALVVGTYTVEKDTADKFPPAWPAK